MDKDKVIECLTSRCAILKERVDFLNNSIERQRIVTETYEDCYITRIDNLERILSKAILNTETLAQAKKQY